MEHAESKECSSTGVACEEECQMFSQPSTSFVKVPATGKRQKKTVKENGCKPKEKAGDAEVPKPTRRKVPIPPLPAHLPPVNLIHRDVLRAWCQEMKLSSKGQKLDAYKRLLAGAFPEQMHDLKNVPDTPKEARVKTFRKKMKIEEGEMPCSQMTIPLEVVPVPQEQLPALTEPPVLYEEVTTTVATSASEAVLASWSKIVAQANHNMKKKNESVCSTATAETSGSTEELWCVVHGRSFTESTKGWVRLQFHGGQVWVPDKKGKVIALFLLPACNFPPPHLEDNLLCPRCIHRNKVLNKSLHD
ncbi:developmental pluripotency-associated protein 4 isoform X2 [Cricetulus griseus]|uniref:Developmental pluripotency-associated protein 4 isoform X2 n=1 Tax=Cricetulus griseus TaxID=10029 RepID=A0A9J7FUG9_CRIGR|nr:developmental pluripotency-associated protein 4 isoform X2 [Cricetulus griseus]